MRVEFAVLVFATLCGVAASASAEPLHIEPGLWDVTYSYSLQGQPPPEVLAAMTPEKRAAIEKAWASQAGKTKTKDAQTCVTAEELAKGTAFENDPQEPKKGCERTVGTQTATQWNLVERCSGPNGVAERHVQISAPDAKDVTGVMNATKGEGAAASGLNMTFTGKWSAKECGDVK